MKRRMGNQYRQYTTKERLLNWVKANPATGCWEFMGYLNNRGYGTMNVNGKSYLSHRLSWEIYHGPIPAGICVCHIFDNRSCANPEHLFLGTPEENTQDMIKKGRAKHGPAPRLYGEFNPSSKLTLEEVTFIKAKYRRGLGHILARQFSVAPSTIHRIVTGECWNG